MNNIKDFAQIRGNMGIGFPHERDSYDLDMFLSDYQMNLQRPLVWSEENKKDYIIYLLITRQPIGAYLIKYSEKKKGVKYDKDVYGVLDGKQRINAVLEFLEKKFTINMDGVEMDIDDLRQIQNNPFFFAFSFNVGHDYMLTDKTLIQMFLILNTKGVPQQTEHIQNLENNINYQPLQNIIHTHLQNTEEPLQLHLKILPSYQHHSKQTIIQFEVKRKNIRLEFQAPLCLPLEYKLIHLRTYTNDVQLADEECDSILVKPILKIIHDIELNWEKYSEDLIRNYLSSPDDLGKVPLLDVIRNTNPANIYIPNNATEKELVDLYPNDFNEDGYYTKPYFIPYYVLHFRSLATLIKYRREQKNFASINQWKFYLRNIFQNINISDRSFLSLLSFFWNRPSNFTLTQSTLIIEGSKTVEDLKILEYINRCERSSLQKNMASTLNEIYKTELKNCDIYELDKQGNVEFCLSEGIETFLENNIICDICKWDMKHLRIKNEIKPNSEVYCYKCNHCLDCCTCIK